MSYDSYTGRVRVSTLAPERAERRRLVDDLAILAIPVEGSGAMSPLEAPPVIPPEPTRSSHAQRLVAFAIVVFACVATALTH